MSKYLIFIYESEAAYAAAGPSVNDEIMAGHDAFADYAGDALLGGHALELTSTATSVRFRSDGTATVTDGPFAETKEALGGYYLVEASDLDHALDLAKHVPARFGGVEVRPVMVFG